jgi:hypothetical protein
LFTPGGAVVRADELRSAANRLTALIGDVQAAVIELDQRCGRIEDQVVALVAVSPRGGADSAVRGVVT